MLETAGIPRIIFPPDLRGDLSKSAETAPKLTNSEPSPRHHSRDHQLRGRVPLLGGMVQQRPDLTARLARAGLFVPEPCKPEIGRYEAQSHTIFQHRFAGFEVAMLRKSGRIRSLPSTIRRRWRGGNIPGLAQNRPLRSSRYCNATRPTPSHRPSLHPLLRGARKAASGSDCSMARAWSISSRFRAESPDHSSPIVQLCAFPGV